MDDLESLEQTLDILSRPALIKGIGQGLDDLRDEGAQVLSKDEARASSSARDGWAIRHRVDGNVSSGAVQAPREGGHRRCRALLRTACGQPGQAGQAASV